MTRYVHSFRDVVLHLSLDGKPTADKDLVSGGAYCPCLSLPALNPGYNKLAASIQVCEYVLRGANVARDPSTTVTGQTHETRSMLGMISRYVALLSDMACLMAAASPLNPPAVLVQNVYLLKKIYVKGGIGQVYRRPALGPINADIDLRKAQRYQMAEARATRVVVQPTLARISITVVERSSPTLDSSDRRLGTRVH